MVDVSRHSVTIGHDQFSAHTGLFTRIVVVVISIQPLWNMQQLQSAAVFSRACIELGPKLKPDGMLALLGEAGVIEDQDAIALGGRSEHGLNALAVEVVL